ncbi:MAG: zinc ribbon domain-containing protein [Deltaproteobacteria bacterium]|nr:zinc ribbon domain-containing protein [Deltaproteobacteria bacterium]MBW2601940.1 zinc ribbon domain-containing protein [Deltaproteobacteria bacterium]
MPLYEFRCPKCGLEFEEIVFPNDRDPVRCPECKASNAKRLLSIFSSSNKAGNLGASQSSCGTPPAGFS